MGNNGYEEKGCTDPQTQSVYLLIATSMGVTSAIECVR